MKAISGRKLVAVIGTMVVFAICFLVIGMFIDIQIILKLDGTPIPFTFILPFVGALIGFLLAFRSIDLHD